MANPEIAETTASESNKGNSPGLAQGVSDHKPCVAQGTLSSQMKVCTCSISEASGRQTSLSTIKRDFERDAKSLETETDRTSTMSFGGIRGPWQVGRHTQMAR